MTQASNVAESPVSPQQAGASAGWGSTCAIFSAVVIVALAATVGVAWQWGGQHYLASAITAWGLVWGAALIALVLIFLGRQLGQGLGAVLIGMGIRMGLPLMAALFLTSESPVWTETKLMPFVLGNYFLALIAETSLAVKLLAGTTPLVRSTPRSTNQLASKT